MRVRAAFDAAAAERGFALDAAQRLAADRLADVAAGLGGRTAPRGAYLVGRVGRGKSFLLDVLARTVPGALRVHLHSFARDLHRAVHAHSHEPPAVAAALEELVGDRRLLCFDEVSVHDPGDAALLTRALRELPGRRTAVVATSNHRIDDLLPDPMFHHLMLPGIALLHELTEEVAVDGPVDHRRDPRGPRRGFSAGWFLSPGAPGQLAAAGLARGAGGPVELEVSGRRLRAREAAGELVRFAFADLCEAPTSAADVLALAERHRRWVLEDVPRLRERGPDARQRFAGLVDVLADRDAELSLVSAHPLADVLATGAGAVAVADGPPPPGWPPDFARTASRLALLRTAPPGPAGEPARPSAQPPAASAGWRGSSNRSTAAADASGSTSAR